MRVSTTGMTGLLVIEPNRFSDERGFFLESFQSDRYRDAGICDRFVQDNHSRSYRSVLRGLHYQMRRPQAQIVTVMRGRIFDAVVDLRPDSISFGRWFGVELGEDGPCQMYMAPGFAHGFCVLSEIADLHYKVSRIYDPTDEAGLNWGDPDVGIAWPISDPVLSARDASYPHLRAIRREALPNATGQDRRR